MSNIDVFKWKYGLFAGHKNDKYVSRSVKELGEYAEAELIIMRAFTDENSVYINVGANIGALAVPMAKHVKHVFALEPIPYLYNLLCANLTINDLKNVTPMMVAGGKTNGKCSFPGLDYSVTNNFGSAKMTKFTGKNEAPVVKIEVDCDLLSMDVEGWEMDVLEGAQEMINRCKPVLFVENDREENGDQMIKYIEEMGYECYWHVYPLYRPENFNGCKENSFIRDGALECSVNMLCVPKGTQFDLLSRAEVGSFKDRFNAIHYKP